MPGYIYLLAYCTLDVSEYIYKIGMTERALLERLKTYPQNYIKLTDFYVSIPNKIEAILKKKFCNNAKLKLKHGTEYFIGNRDYEQEMINFVHDECVNYIVNHVDKNDKFICDACNNIFTKKGSLIRHYDRCNITKQINANKNNNDKNLLEMLQLKFDEANKIINEQKTSMTIFQMKLEFTDKMINEKNNVIKEKNKVIEDQNEEIKYFRKYYDYFLMGNGKVI